MSSLLKFTRRRVLQSLGMGAAGWTMRDLLFTQEASADPNAPPKILIFCYFSGGWDQLVGLDPRPFLFGKAPTQASSKVWPQQSTRVTIDPAYSLITDTVSKAFLAAEGNAANANPDSGTRGQVRLGTTPIMGGPAFRGTVFDPNTNDPAVADAVSKALCVVRGVNMGTLTHEVGRRYFLTGKFPRGLQAAGSSLSTWVAYQNGSATGVPIPNLTVGVETYNEGLPAFASGLVVNSSGDLVNVLKPLAPSVSAPQGAVGAQVLAVKEFEAQNDCWEEQMDGDGLVTALRASRLSALSMVQRNLSGLFSFSPTTTDPKLLALYAAFGLDPTNQGPFYKGVNGAAGQAMIAAQAITPQSSNGGVPSAVSNCVSIQLATGIDDHDSDWSQTHSSSLRAGFDALGRLIRYLQTTHDELYPNDPSKMLIDRTQIMGFSEFARTPNVNSRGGRDHHLASSCFMAGAGIKGGQVIGGTRDSDFGSLLVDPSTGVAFNDINDDLSARAVPSGYLTIRPSDLHATFLKAAGLSFSNISNQQPNVIPAILKG
jgi:hypothetical protein